MRAFLNTVPGAVALALEVADEPQIAQLNSHVLVSDPTTSIGAFRQVLQAVGVSVVKQNVLRFDVPMAVLLSFDFAQVL